MQARSMLAGEDSLPKADRARDRVIRDYEDIVRKLRTVPMSWSRKPVGTPTVKTAHRVHLHLTASNSPSKPSVVCLFAVS